jgi:hypothetical protein
MEFYAPVFSDCFIHIYNRGEDIVIGEPHNYFHSVDGDDFISFCSEGFGFRDLEKFYDFWGSDLTGYYIKKYYVYDVEGGMDFSLRWYDARRMVRIEDERGIFLKYFTFIFLQLARGLMLENKSERFKVDEAVDFIDRFCWDDEHENFYDWLESCFEKNFKFGIWRNGKENFYKLCEFRWFRQVTGV